MRFVITSYDDPLEQAIWEDFMLFFRTIKCYDDWTDEEIATSVNEDDIDEYCKFIKDHLVYNKRGKVINNG